MMESSFLSNSEFPERKHYAAFINDFARKLDSRDCFYIFGSYTRDSDFVPGRSDIDGGLVLNTDFITDRENLEFLSRTLGHCLRAQEKLARCHPGGIGIGLNLTDRATNRDGRFLSYDDEYTSYLKKKAVIVSGPDFIQEMQGLNYKRDCLRSAAFNLREVRNGLLMYSYNLLADKKKADRTILHSINVLRGMPKKLLSALGKEVDFENDGYFGKFVEAFPEYDVEQYDRAQKYRATAERFYGILNDKNRFDHAADFLNATERMIQAYVEKFSGITSHEVKGRQ